MQSLWDESEAARYTTDLELRAYSSRLLGRDQSLVLHGGGNTSVKLWSRNILDQDEELLYVKGSGWDLESIQPQGFAPCRLTHLLGLSRLEKLSDVQMASELRNSVVDASAPAPSVESILHAILPHKFVDHTHADSVVTITNTADGEARIKEIYGDTVVVIPYVMAGFDLAKLASELFPQHASERTIGMVLLKHGVFSFGATARESYERMIELVGKAEDYLQRQDAWTLPESAPVEAPAGPLREELAELRKNVSAAAGAPMILTTHRDAESLSFVRREDVAEISQQGPATPDHVIRTKPLPLLGRDVATYKAAYARYFERYSAKAEQALTMLDPAPRVILDHDLGLVAAGRTSADAAIVSDIYHHTMEIVQRSTALGGYRSHTPEQSFQVEYWDLEQAKLRRPGKPPVFTGEVALVTGAASGIGKACVQALLDRGSAVVGLDLNPAVSELHGRKDFLGVACDVSSESALEQALERAALRFGGLDMLVLNAGIFPSSTRIEALRMDEWERTMSINLNANMALMRLSHPLLKRAPHGGRVVVIGSKNVPAPGPAAAAYSVSKAGLLQLARVAALEWAGDGIRVNVIHPNQVFDTALWSEELLQSRAAHYKQSVEQYKTSNLLHVEVTSRDVAEMAAEMCGPLFSRTTGSQVPVDGGNDRVI